MFPVRFGAYAERSIAKLYTDQLVDKLSYAYSEDSNSFSFAELWATAVGIEWTQRYIGQQENNAIPELAIDLDHWEKILGIGKNPTLSDDERRKLIAAKRLFISNTMDYLETIIKKLVGDNVFDQIIAENSVQYWAGNPSMYEGYDWVAGICALVVHLNTIPSFKHSDYDKLISKIKETLADILPIYSTLNVSIGSFFLLNTPNEFGINPLS